MYLPHHQAGIINGLLYEFEDNFDKKRAIKDFKYGGKTKLEYKKLIFYELQILKCLINSLDRIYLDWNNQTIKFIPIPECISNVYAFLLFSFKDIQNSSQFIFTPEIKKLSFDNFSTLKGDNLKQINLWKKERSNYLNFLGQIKDLTLIKGIKNYPLPYRLKAIIDNFDLNTKEYAQLKKKALLKNTNISQKLSTTDFPDDFSWDSKDKRIYHFGKYGDISFSNSKSIKYKIFKMIVNNRGNWIRLSVIIKRISRKNNYVRAVIRDLRKMVKPLKKISINSSGEGSVKITILE